MLLVAVSGQAVRMSVARVLCRPALLRSARSSVRQFSTIRIFDEKERADENLYFSKQDEALLKKIFEAADKPEGLEWAKLAATQTDADMSSEDKVKLVFMKNGIPPSANPQLLKDLVELMDRK